MIYELTNATPLPGLANPFAPLPPVAAGLALAILFIVLAVIFLNKEMDAKKSGKKNTRWPESLRGVPMPLLLAAGVYTGVFLTFYALIDEVMINLEHPYNLFHFGYFSMSSKAWVDGTVELVYYLLHTPFAWSRTSLIVANFAISFLVGLGHVVLVGKLFDEDASPAIRTLQLCAFALCAPVIVLFASGFGNGLVSLVFLAAMADAANHREQRSLIWSGLLPLLRPDAIYMSVVNIGVLLWKRRLATKHAFLTCLPVVSMAAYFGLFRLIYGHWIPVPVRFKALKPSMLAMFSGGNLAMDALNFVLQPFHLLGILIAIEASRRWLNHREPAASGRTGYAWCYLLGTAPLFMFYSFTHATIGDFSFGTYPRYWLVFELSLAIAVIASLTQENSVGKRWRHPLIGVLLVVAPLIQGWLQVDSSRGRPDGAFAGAFTEHYIPANLTLASSEMDTFGFMVDRPVLDLWGYSNPAIAFSTECNRDRIRSNPRAFLDSRTDIYWPYWFTPGLASAKEIGTFETVEKSLAEFHHTGPRGNLLGDLTQVLSNYDVLIIQAKVDGAELPTQIAYLVSSTVTKELRAALETNGFALSRERELDWVALHRFYDPQKRVAYTCV